MNWIIIYIHIVLNCGYEIRWSYMYDPCSYEHNFNKSSLINSSREHLEPTNDQLPRSVASYCSSVALRVTPVSRGHRFKPHWSPEFFRLLYCWNCVHNCEDRTCIFTWSIVSVAQNWIPLLTCITYPTLSIQHEQQPRSSTIQAHFEHRDRNRQGSSPNS